MGVIFITNANVHGGGTNAFVSPEVRGVGIEAEAKVFQTAAGSGNRQDSSRSDLPPQGHHMSYDEDERTARTDRNGQIIRVKSFDIKAGPKPKKYGLKPEAFED